MQGEQDQSTIHPRYQYRHRGRHVEFGVGYETLPVNNRVYCGGLVGLCDLLWRGVIREGDSPEVGAFRDR